ncbi:MAG: ribonuclease III [Oscillospiraceae bacterium]|nr:ribonuclease III [Oscillospiraceae bacterium]
MSCQTDLKSFQKKLDYTFRDEKYLAIALTHSSYANEGKKENPCNERQEFLGDAVLSIIVSDYLFRHYSHLPEGELTKLRAALVCEKALCQYALQLGLGEFLLLGRGEESTGGRKRPSILADAFEAVIAAIYLDGGMDPAKKFVLYYAIPAVENHTAAAFKDYKTVLQEIIQKNPEERVTYELVEESGPDHNKRFVVEVHLNSNVIGRGEGRSKKNAEQAAAKVALELMGQ